MWASHADIARASLATIPTGPERLRVIFRRLPADRFPLVSSMADTIMPGDEQRFEFGLDLLLAGLAALR